MVNQLFVYLREYYSESLDLAVNTSLLRIHRSNKPISQITHDLCETKKEVAFKILLVDK